MLDTTGFVPQPVRRSPLEHREAISSSDGELRLEEKKFIGKLILRGRPDQIGAAVESAIGFALPTSAGGSSTSGALSALWLGPSEWMVLTPENEEKALSDNIAAGLQGVHSQIVDVTDYYSVIRLVGSESRELLMKLTMLDLHPSKFGGGTAKSSIFGRVPAILNCVQGDAASGPVFELIIRASHADYLWCLLALGGREYGMPVQKPEGRVKIAMPH